MYPQYEFDTVIEMLKRVVQAARWFSPTVLFVPGLTMLVLGLTAWLGGMWLRRFVLALAGAAAGGLVVYLLNPSLSGETAIVAGLAAAGGAAFSAVLPRAAAGILLSELAIFIPYDIAAQMHVVKGQKTLFARIDAGRELKRLSVQDSLEFVHSELRGIPDSVKSEIHDWRHFTFTDRVVILAVSLGLVSLAWSSQRLAGALMCSVFGTALVFAGLIALLSLKGSPPASLVEKQDAFFGFVLLGMVAFGTLEQFLLCPSPKRKQKTGSEKTDPKLEESEGTPGAS